MQLTQILIIDDQIESVALLLKYLHGNDFDVLVALDGRDGVRKALEGYPDLILLDVSMPHINGFDVCRQLKANARTAHIPVIFLSANVSLAHKLEGFSAGGADYIGKPFNSEEVLARIYVQLGTLRSLADLQLRLGESLNTETDTPETVSGSMLDARLVDKAMQLVHEPDFEWEGMETFARKVGTNEKKLTELFRLRIGITAFEYLTTLRLESARCKLAGEKLQIQVISEEAGYRNPSDFSRAFRARYGVGPRQYRKAFRTETE